MKPGFGARYFVVTSGFPSGASDNPPASAGDVRDTGLIPGSGRSPGDGDGNPFQYSCLENPMDKRSLTGYTPWVTKSQTQLKTLSAVSAHTYTHVFACFFAVL